VTSLKQSAQWRNFSLLHVLTTLLISLDMHLSSLGRQDVGVTGVDDGHGGATEELTAGGTKLDLYYGFKSAIMTLQSLK
jgi:hypothetical protein